MTGDGQQAAEFLAGRARDRPPGRKKKKILKILIDRKINFLYIVTIEGGNEVAGEIETQISKGDKTMRVTIQTSVDELRTMQHFDQKFYGTPYAYSPYVASRPQWRDDVVLATPQEIIEAQGWDCIDESCSDCIGAEQTCIECANTLTYAVEVQ